jgi:ABC-type cobalamin transport system ATPase subunit
MIVIGYQGIGKSTLAGKNHKYIDLESGSFWVDGKRADDWYIVYCQIAEHLSRQGYTVFTSSHEVVRKTLRNSWEHVVLAFPSIHLKEEWIEKLATRYAQTKLEKDYKALMNAKDRYTENIMELNAECGNGVDYLTIQDMSYDLEKMLEHL